MRPPGGLRPYIDEMGTWVVGLAFFSLGIDGLALMIGAKCQGAAFVAIPLLLPWEAALLLLFFRSALPAFERLPEGRGLGEQAPQRQWQGNFAESRGHGGAPV